MSAFGISFYQQNMAYSARTMAAHTGGASSFFQSNNAKSKEQGKTLYGVSLPDKYTSARDIKNESVRDSEQMRKLIRDLHKNSDGNKSISASDAGSIIEQSQKTDEKEEQKLKKPLNYNYKEISTRILRAKNSTSAGQAFLAAKRKTLEIKRKIAAKEGDADELQMALNHARSMELAARKKKHNLEMEEMCERTQRADEKKDEQEEAMDRMKASMLSLGEEELSKKEEDILDKRQETFDEVEEELKESGAGDMDEMLSELNEMLAEFGEEELEQLEEAMELMEDMEFMDPHMSKEELKEVKIKHRAAESKAIVKADMDYLKAMIKHQLSSGGSAIPGMGSSSAAAPAGTLAVLSAPSVSAPAEASIDVQA